MYLHKYSCNVARPAAPFFIQPQNTEINTSLNLRNRSIGQFNISEVLSFNFFETIKLRSRNDLSNFMKGSHLPSWPPTPGHAVQPMRSYFLTFTLSIILFKIGSATTTNNNPQCRCLPSDSCWPNSSEWNAFNISLSGKLLAVKPVASVCHDPAFNEEACQEVNASFAFSLWRSNQPGKLQDYTNPPLQLIANN